MTSTMRTQKSRSRFLLAAGVFVLSITAGLHASPASAAAPAESGPAALASATARERTLPPIVLKSGPDGPTLPHGRLVVEATAEAFGDRELLAALDAGARVDGLSVGEPTPQAGPYHDSTTWHWEFCITLSFPDGSTWEKCIGFTITVSTDVEGPIHTGGPVVLTSESRDVPAKLCWETTDKYGNVITRCIEITIETSGTRND